MALMVLVSHVAVAATLVADMVGRGRRVDALTGVERLRLAPAA